jgi:hypothetical protein
MKNRETNRDSTFGGKKLGRKKKDKRAKRNRGYL